MGSITGTGVYCMGMTAKVTNLPDGSVDFNYFADMAAERSVTETELVQTARNVIRDVLNNQGLDAEYPRLRADLAMWVIENIWTPESDG